MRIKEINENAIIFDNNNTITFDHDQNCCEWNYADFMRLDDLARNYDFAEKLVFEAIDEAGFRFGDKGQMFFIPCYSYQNGYYSCDIDIYYNSIKVLGFDCEFIEN